MTLLKASQSGGLQVMAETLQGIYPLVWQDMPTPGINS